PAGVAELAGAAPAVGHRVLALVVPARLGGDQPGGEPGVGGDVLERRAGGVLALDRPVDEGVVALRVVEGGPLGVVDAVDEGGGGCPGSVSAPGPGRSPP